MSDIITLEEGQTFKSPPCIECGSWNTYTQGTVQLPPMTKHKCKCKNCGENWKVITRRKKSHLESTHVDSA